MQSLLMKVESNDALCIRCFGLKFCKIQCIVNEVDEMFELYASKQRRHRKLNSLTLVLLYLYFLNNYCSLEKLGLMFNVPTSTAWRYVEFMSSVFEGLDCLKNVSIDGSKCLLVDGTETEIERPLVEENFVGYYGRKKKYSKETSSGCESVKLESVFYYVL